MFFATSVCLASIPWNFPVAEGKLGARAWSAALQLLNVWGPKSCGGLMRDKN